MKLYFSKIGASISMVYNNILIDSIKKISDKIDVVIETGTFVGNGSTKMLSEIFKNSNIKLYTIEVDKWCYNQAVSNLGEYKFVKCLNGLSLNINECIDFINNDDFIKNHIYIDDVYIDNIENPIKFYTDEINKLDINTEQNILEKCIKENIDKKLFIVLDSAGGIGYLEFKKVIELLKDKNYYLLLDDIHHIKHFRSYEYIKKNKNFTILSMNYDDGWLLCYHNMGLGLGIGNYGIYK